MFLSRKCEERSEEVCISVPVTKCEAVPFADCQDIKELHKIRDDKIQVKELEVRSCRPGPTVNITEVKQMPVCEDVTKEMCDSRWEVDEQDSIVVISIIIIIIVPSSSSSLSSS